MPSGDGIFVDLYRLFGGDVHPVRPGEPPRPMLPNPLDPSRSVDPQYERGRYYPLIDRPQLLQLLDIMDQSGLASSVLDMFVADAICPNPDTGKALTIKGPSTYDREIRELFRELDVENLLPYIVRGVAKYGDHFRRNIYAVDEGITHIIPAPIHRVQMEIDPERKTLNGYKEQGRLFRDKTQPVSWPWDYSRWTLPGKDDTEAYGSGILAAGIRSWTSLAISEDFALMYRISRLPDRLLFKIDVGESPMDEANDIVQSWRRNMRKKTLIDPIKSVLSQDYKSINPMEDLFMGVRSNARSDVTPLTTSSGYDPLTDLSYYLNKFLMDVGVMSLTQGLPMAGGGGGSDSGGASDRYDRRKRLANQDIRYARQVKRLQKAAIGGPGVRGSGLVRLLEIHFRLRRMHSLVESSSTFPWIDENGDPVFQLSLQPPSFLEEFERQEVLRLRAELSQVWLEMLDLSGGALKPIDWTMYVLRDIAKVPEKDLSRVMQKTLPVLPEGSTKEEWNDMATASGDLSTSQKDALNDAIRSTPALQERISRMEALFHPEKSEPELNGVLHAIS